MVCETETGSVGTSHHLQEAITMRSSADRGRVYRRCGCRDAHRHRLGVHYPRLAADSGHGSWTFAVDLPSPGLRRTTVRRGADEHLTAEHGFRLRMVVPHLYGYKSPKWLRAIEYLTEDRRGF